MTYRHTLYPYTHSWWNGSNIPGKVAENMTYIAGIDNYEAKCREKMAGWKGFEVSPAQIKVLANVDVKGAGVTTTATEVVGVGA